MKKEEYNVNYILFHPFTSRAFESSLIGILYQKLQIENTKIILIANNDIKNYIKKRLNNYIEIGRAHV